jgi:hypothetical protein
MAITRLIPVVRFINIDGFVIGSAEIPVHPDWLDAISATIGPGYQASVPLPPGPIGDERCPYRLEFAIKAEVVADAH